MAPRRSVKISPAVENVPRKTLRGRQSKSKPLKTPGIITISIPVKKDVPDVLDTERSVDSNMKISLANEVAKAQLMKEPVPIRQNTPVVRKKCQKKAVTVLKGKKNIGAKVKEKKCCTTKGTKPSAKPKTKPKKTPAKAPAKTTVVKKTNTRKRKADPSEQKSPIKNTKRRKASEEIFNLQNNVKEENLNVINNEQENIPIDIINQTPMVVIPDRKRKLSRGKQNINASKEKVTKNMKSFKGPRSMQMVTPPEPQSFSCKSPILQSPCRPTRSSMQVKDAALVGSRKTSTTSSISNLSWTQDISSSSSPSRFTVSSNDFIRFDKRMPIIQLHKTTEKQINSSQSKVTINNSTIPPESEASEDFNSLIDINSLKLSSSSQSSVETQVDDHKTNVNRKDYKQSAENLSRALELIDMEFINWIHDPDFVCPDLNKLKDKLFEVLNNEFCALKHCRNLQEILKYSKSDNNIDQATNNTKRPILETDYNNVKNDMAKDNENLINIITDNNNFCNMKPVNDPIKNKDVDTRDSKNNTVEETIKNKTGLSLMEFEDDLVKPSTSRDFSDRLHSRHSSESDLDNTYPSNQHSKDHNELISPPQSPHDDGDTISLYAESLTGLESSRLNTSISPPIAVEKETEEYIPEPVQRVSNYDYNPTKIVDHGDKVIKTICEKQHADSTSIYREINSVSPIQKDTYLNPFIEANKNAQMNTNDSSSSPIYDGTDFNSFSRTYQDDKSSSPIENKKVNSKYPLLTETNQNSLMYNHSNKNSTTTRWNKPTGNIDNEINKNPLTKYVPEIGTNQIYSPKYARKPMLIANDFKPKINSIIYSSCCYFNIMGTCRATQNNEICKFRHHIPDSAEIKSKLSELKYELFIREYDLIRRNHKIMTMYGLCFLDECVERKLTRMLVEIAFDFVKLHEINNTLKVHVVETALLYLNNVDLSECHDLLRMPVAGDQLLSEYFMQIMSSTQNFSRFKPIFLNITHLIVNINRKIPLEVAQQILERVCILPFDASTARALIQIMRLTDPNIFMNTITAQFEKQICAKREIFEEYLALKKNKTIDDRNHFSMAPVRHNVPLSPYKPMTQTVRINEEHSLPNSREGLPSPDTTHLDLMNKTTDGVILPITRTISGLNVTTRSYDVRYSPHSSTSEEVSLKPTEWRHKIVTRRPNQRPLQIRAPSHQSKNYRHGDRLVTFGGHSSNYPPRHPNY